MEQLSKKWSDFTYYPEKVIQFGEGNFLRAFVDWQLQQLNNHGEFLGSAVVVQPIAQGLGKMLAEQDNLYTVILEGLLDGQTVATSEIITTVSRVINPYEDYQSYLQLAENDDLEIIVSNTTEAGISYHAGDQLNDTPPVSYPAKLTALLYRRFELGKKGFTIIPCELIDRNGEKLQQLVERYAKEWNLSADFITWLENENTFCCSLVDRIVPGYPRDRAAELNEKHGYVDNLMVKAEPFLLWVIEGPQSVKELLPLEKIGLNVVVTDDMTPYRERKVHLLNGPHTTMVETARLAGLETVGEVMEDPDFSVLVDQLFTQELIPMLSLPEAELTAYAEQIKERFKNPFVKHELASIALNSISKYRARILPILLRFNETNGTNPPYITLALASTILAYRGDEFEVHDDPEVKEIFAEAWKNPSTVVETILASSQLWGQDLTQVKGLTSDVQQFIDQLQTKGAREIVKDLNKGAH
ncbi:tagaturonate reductase [Enterococcus timonensis]|uniref:tagaturonate reductase n=1 Tax=Enterococcus timonensis TaxID=1852364 RepID=UPI0008D9F652|nr:tagaturonate reductase [Enterococcus timonensis]